jgi:putative ABC transport system permease protein
MFRLRAFASRWREELRRRRHDAEMDEELRSHLELAVEENLRRGLSSEESRRAANLRLGGVEQIKEVGRDARGFPWLASCLRDLRFALRMMGRNPGFTAASVLTLALGIGANTAIFSLMDAVMLRSLPVKDPGELQLLAMRSPRDDGEPNPIFTNPLWEEIRNRQDVFASVFAWGGSRLDLSQGGEAQFLRGIYASGDYFNGLGIVPEAGRLLTAADDRRGCAGAAVLSDAFWRDHYGRSADAVGSSIVLERHSFPIVGVAERGFSGVEVGEHFDVALPLCAEALVRGDHSSLDQRGSWWLHVMGRRKSGVGEALLAEKLRAVSPGVFEGAVPRHWKPEEQKRFLARWLTSLPGGRGVSDLRREYDRPLAMLMGVVALVLMIACANIAGLMLAGGMARRREIAIRMAVGASRSRLVRQLLTECLLLSLCGAALGILLSLWGNALLVSNLSGSRGSVVLDLSPNLRVLAFTGGISILTALLFGALPAFRSTRVSLVSAMKGGAEAGGEGGTRFRLGRGIVASQVALSLVLLVGAGLFLRTYSNLLWLDAGFDRSNLLLASLDLQRAAVSPESREELLREIVEKAAAIPGAVSASRSVLTPVGRMAWNDYLTVDEPGAPSGDDALAYFNFVTPGYFATMGTPLLGGRDFGAGDASGSPRVAIVNETLARKFFHHKSPLGGFFRMEDSPGKLSPPIEVVGVVKDSKYQSLREDFLPTAYYPASQMQDPMFEAVVEIRTAVHPSLLIPALRETVARANKSIVIEFGTLEQQIDDSLSRDRLLALLSGFFGGLGLLLTAIGLYGVMAYVVSRRSKEIGIRMALGARRDTILRLILKEVCGILAAGLLAGAAVSLGASRLVERMLYGMAARDVTTLLAAAGILSLAGLLAGVAPVRRAAGLDPMRVLRED